MPASPPEPRSLLPGLGFSAGIIALGGVGVADGIVAWSRAPRGSLPTSMGFVVVLQCVAILLTFGIGLGLLEELLLLSAATVPWLARGGRWFVGGPRRWFAREPDHAAALAAVALGVAITLGPVYPIAYSVIQTFHSKPLAALAVFLAPFALGVAALVTLLLVSGPLRWLAHRAGRVASPGTVIVASLLGVTAQAVRFFSLNWVAFHNLEFSVVAVGAGLALANTLALLLLGRSVARRGAPLRRRVPLALAAASLVAFAVSALSLGARQTVAATVFNHSLLAQRVGRALQVAVDLDGDGYSALFNGGDCNDFNARISPRARDVPGNGVDENCSGRDARVERDEGDGHLAPMPEHPATPTPSFVLLSIDAMRPDHMGCYGYRRPTTPNLDRFARQAARFTNAYCASPRSLRSFASIWTGRYPSRVDWGSDVEFPPLEPSNHTLAERLREAGYLTASFNGTSYFSRTRGFFQGFEQVTADDSFKSDPGPAVGRIMGFLEERDRDGRPFFLWSHLMQPHDPYDDRTAPRDFGHAPVDRYDEEIAAADDALGPVLARLDEMAARHPLVVVVIGDHGEGFGEHGVFHHSFDLHDEALRVPLLVRAPGVAPGPRAALSCLFDLNPTLLNLAALRPDVPVSGYSLVPVLQDPSPGTLTPPGWRSSLYAEVTPDGVFSSEQKSLYAPPYKLIHDLRLGTWELFDIAHDRGEVHNLYDARPQLAADLRERLVTWTDFAASPGNRTNEIIDAARLPAEPPMQHPVHVRFGDVAELLGYDLPAERVPMLGTYRAVLYWRVLRRTRAPLYIVVSFEPTDGQPIWPHFIARHVPLYGRYPTTEWRPGEILRDDVALRIDPEMRPVRLRSFVSLEHSNRQPVPPARGGADGRVEIAAMEIVPRP